MTFETISKSIQSQHYVPIDFPLRKEDFEAAINVFMRFLDLPMDVKKPLYFKIDPEDRGTEVGYKRYLRDTGQTDNREYVHYHPAAETGFADVRQDIVELDMMLNAMKKVYGLAKSELQKVMREFDTQYPAIYNQYFPQDKQERLYLRFLKYDRAMPGDFLAKGHYDRGGCTLALAESAPGLHIGTDTEDMQPVYHKEGQALFFPGIRFPELTSNDFIPSWHAVIQKSEDVYSDTVARWAIVLFADPQEMSKVTYEEAHTPKK
jgi:isopenicillin N synthase-like dioxygenase